MVITRLRSQSVRNCHTLNMMLHSKEAVKIKTFDKWVMLSHALSMCILATSALLLGACSLSSNPPSSPAAEVTQTALAGTGTTGNSQPTPFSCKAGVIEQSFEHGFMFWIGKTSAEKCAAQHS